MKKPGKPVKPAKNPMRMDPSRTGLIRRLYGAEMRRRFGEVQRAVFQWAAGSPTTNAPRYTFPTKAAKLAAFNKWLADQIKAKILSPAPTPGEPTGAKPWSYKYIDSAYRQGALRSYLAIHAPTLKKPLAFFDGSKAAFLAQAFGRPERVDKLRLLYTRSYEDLNGVTATMAAQLSRVLADGMANGTGALAIARKMSGTITGITRKRALLITTTEIIHAHAEGQLDGMEDLGVETAGVEEEFLTAGDSGVCPKCRALSGKVFTIKAARGIIPVHPRCRCAWVPHVKVPKLKLRKRVVI